MAVCSRGSGNEGAARRGAFWLKTGLLGLTMLPASLVLGQDVWTLRESLRAALTTHPTILGRESSAVAAVAERDGAQWQRYPTPSFEASGADSGGSTSVVRVDQPLWTFGRISAGVDAAGYRVGAADWAVNEARREIALRVAAVWTEARRQQLRQGHAAVGIEQHEKLLALIMRRVEGEISPSVDRDFARSRLLQAANELLASKQAISNALNQLSQLVGRPVASVSGELDDTLRQEALEGAQEQGFEQSPTLKRLSEELLAAGEDIRSKRSVYMPQLSVRLEQYMGQRPGGLPRDSRALLLLTAQPGAGLSAGSGVDAAIARRDASRLAREAALRELRQQIAADWEERLAARDRYANLRQAREMAAEVFDSYTRQFAAGRKTWIDVLNAVREVTQTDLAATDALAQAAAATARLRIVIGEFNLRAIAHGR